MEEQNNSFFSDDGSKQGNTTKIDFGHWYVLSIQSGREMKVKEEIGNLTSNRYHLFIPRRELFHRFNGVYQKVIRPLFPGYLFIYKKIEALLTDLQSSHLNGRIHPVMFDRKFAMVRESEMALLMKITGPTGLVKISQASLCKDRRVVINSGPLKDLSGSILSINKRKRKAVLQVELLNRMVRVTVGLEVVGWD